jgi:hypothetical protein
VNGLLQLPMYKKQKKQKKRLTHLGWHTEDDDVGCLQSMQEPHFPILAIIQAFAIPKNKEWSPMFWFFDCKRVEKQLNHSSCWFLEEKERIHKKLQKSQKKISIKANRKKKKHPIPQMRIHSFSPRFSLCSSRMHGVWLACEPCTSHSGVCKMRLVDPLGVGVGVWNKARIAIKEKTVLHNKNVKRYSLTIPETSNVFSWHQACKETCLNARRT